MLSWFDIAYATLNIFIIFYCSKKYFSSKKKPFQLFGLGFTFLIVSDFIWVFTVIPWLNIALTLYAYIRLGLYAVFILLVLRALNLFDSNIQAKTNNPKG